MRAEDHSATQQVLGMVRTMLEGQATDRRITSERTAAQDARIDHLNHETAQISREMRRDASSVSELRGEVREMRAAVDERFDSFEQRVEKRLADIAASVRSTSPAVLAAIVTVVVAFVQFAVPALIQKMVP